MASTQNLVTGQSRRAANTPRRLLALPRSRLSMEAILSRLMTKKSSSRASANMPDALQSFGSRNSILKISLLLCLAVKIPEVVKIPAPKEDDSLDQEITFEAENDACDVREVVVNGISLEQSARRSNTLSQAMFQVTQNTINIHIGPFLEPYAGTYQAKFACGDETITKNIMEVTLLVSLF
ncbi:uncharacterized protein LOC134660071 [Cydia amplana]|uniref:uncharacterized protein LOC134660071 n=1 Tax=Cydia amplana TaxID=1869771 RepID=UPI002FE695B8